MKADLPYHFCDWIGCREMVHPGAYYCAAHLAVMDERRSVEMATVPALDEDTFADASQQSNNTQLQPVTGDAGSTTKESNS